MVEDLDVFFQEFGVEVSWVDLEDEENLVEGLGILDQPDLLASPEQFVIATDYDLTVKTSEFGFLTLGAEIEVDGADYTVRAVMKLDDGKLSKVSLSKV